MSTLSTDGVVKLAEKEVAQQQFVVVNGELTRTYIDGSFLRAYPQGDVWMMHYTDASGRTVQDTFDLHEETSFMRTYFGDYVMPASEQAQATVNALYGFVYSQQDMTKYTDLFELIPSLYIRDAGGDLPFQASGTVAGLAFYFRYRGGNLSLRIAESKDRLYSKPLYYIARKFGKWHDGSLSNQQFMKFFVELLQDAEVAPFNVWEFAPNPGYEDSVSTSVGVGNTPEEAWNSISGGEQWREKLMKLQLNPTTITVDDRTFPTQHPRTSIKEKISHEESK